MANATICNNVRYIKISGMKAQRFNAQSESTPKHTAAQVEWSRLVQCGDNCGVTASCIDVKGVEVLNGYLFPCPKHLIKAAPISSIQQKSKNLDLNLDVHCANTWVGYHALVYKWLMIDRAVVRDFA